MYKVTNHTWRKRFFSFFYILILFFITACKTASSGQTAWVPTPYKMPPQALNEIEALNQSAMLSNSTRNHIYALMMQQCLYAEYNGIPCVYPQINYSANAREVK